MLVSRMDARKVKIHYLQAETSVESKRQIHFQAEFERVFIILVHQAVRYDRCLKDIGRCLENNSTGQWQYLPKRVVW